MCVCVCVCVCVCACIQLYVFVPACCNLYAAALVNAIVVLRSSCYGGLMVVHFTSFHLALTSNVFFCVREYVLQWLCCARTRAAGVLGCAFHRWEC